MHQARVKFFERPEGSNNGHRKREDFRSLEYKVGDRHFRGAPGAPQLQSGVKHHLPGGRRRELKIIIDNLVTQGCRLTF